MRRTELSSSSSSWWAKSLLPLFFWLSSIRYRWNLVVFALLTDSKKGSLLLLLVNTSSEEYPLGYARQDFPKPQGDKVTEQEVWKGFRDFFPILEDELHLEFARVLLASDADLDADYLLIMLLQASGSPAELEAILARDWPYLDSYLEEVEQCLSGDCARVSGVIERLGNHHICPKLFAICRNNTSRSNLFSSPDHQDWEENFLSADPALSAACSSWCRLL